MGVLRNTVRNKLREYREIKRTFHPEDNDGGDGVTVAEF
jgi:dsDNA-specific endonuclease/ATPase MutS2